MSTPRKWINFGVSVPLIQNPDNSSTDGNWALKEDRAVETAPLQTFTHSKRVEDPAVKMTLSSSVHGGGLSLTRSGLNRRLI